MTLEQDVEWLVSICKKPASLKYLEPSAHAFSIFFALQNKSYDEQEVAKLSMMGIVATTARLTDNDKFHSIDPQAFLQVANMLLDEEDDGTNYNKLIGKIYESN
jgi:hypothetical protein